MTSTVAPKSSFFTAAKPAAAPAAAGAAKPPAPAAAAKPAAAAGAAPGAGAAGAAVGARAGAAGAVPAKTPAPSQQPVKPTATAAAVPPKPVVAKPAAPAPAPAKAKGDDDDDDDDDDGGGYSGDEFDGYGDDFDEIDEEEDRRHQEEAKAAAAVVAQEAAALKAKAAAAAAAPAVAARVGTFGGASSGVTPVPGAAAAAAPVTVARPLFGGVSQKTEAKNAMQRLEMRARAARAQRVLSHVKLEVESFTFFELQEQTSDEWRARAFKLSLLKHASAQCEYPEQGVQTDTIDTADTGGQAPDDLMRENAANTRAGLTQYNNKRLLQFLATAAPVCEAVCLENAGGVSAYADAALADAALLLPSISAHILPLTLPALFGTRPVVDVHFSARRSGLLIVAYGKPTQTASAAAAADNKSGPAAAAAAASAASTANGVAAESKGAVRGRVSDTFLDGKGLIAVWDVSTPRRPTKILYCDGTPSCCALASDRTHVAFAGLQEGSVAVWDMREQSAIASQTIGSEPNVYPIVGAAFTTDNLLTDNHASAVTRIYSLVSSARALGDDSGVAAFTGSSGADASGSGSRAAAAAAAVGGATAFQIVSLDEDGVALLWTAIELADGDAAGSSDDHGLAIGARIKLIKSTVLDRGTAAADSADDDDDDRYRRARLAAATNGASAGARGNGRAAAAVAAAPTATAPSRSRDLQFRLDDTNEYLIARGNGVIVRACRFGQPPTTAAYELTPATAVGGGDAFGEDEKKPSAMALASALADPCVTVAFSPFLPTCFLAGYESGTVSAFDLSSGSPAMTWPHVCPGGVRALRWSAARPGVFFALDSARAVHAFDLLKSSQGPVHVASTPSCADFLASSGRLPSADDTAASASASASASTSASVASAAATAPRTNFLAFGSSRLASTVDVHVLASALTSPAPNERKRVFDLFVR